LIGNVETRVGIFVVIAVALFILIGFKTGTFGVNRSLYAHYTIICNDCSGLTRKSEVKMAGVAIGWVDKISVSINNSNPVAHVHIVISHMYPLYRDVHVSIKQDGMIGQKYLELFPGSCTEHKLCSGDTFTAQINQVVSTDELMGQLQDLAVTIKAATQEIRDGVRNMAQSNDLERVVTAIDTTASELQTTLEHIRTTARTCNDIADTVKSGQGLAGKLLHDTKIYDSVATSIDTVNTSVEAIKKIRVVGDVHTELACSSNTFNTLCNNYNYKNYFTARIYPTVDQLCLFQLVSYPKRIIKLCENDTCYSHSSIRFGAQYGKIFDTGYGNIIVRGGLFEGTLGVAGEYDIPFGSTGSGVLTSVQLYDFFGNNNYYHNHYNKPHLKWLNKLYCMNRFYIALGYDNCISHNKGNMIAGAGILI